jgi:hypothetical protein
MLAVGVNRPVAGSYWLSPAGVQVAETASYSSAVVPPTTRTRF